MSASPDVPDAGDGSLRVYFAWKARTSLHAGIVGARLRRLPEVRS
jgi:hypothetical protein